MSPHDEHTSADDLALSALGEQLDVSGETHLADCPQCRAEVDELRAVVAGARAATGDDVPQPPPDDVWRAIVEELGLDPAAAAPATAGLAAAGPAGVPAPAEVPGRPVPSAADRPARWGRRSAVLAAAAAAAGLLAGSVVTGLVLSGDDDGGQGQVVASTRLAALPDRRGSGEAEVLGVGDARVLELDVSGLTPGQGFYEVWLLDEKAERLVSIGLLDPARGPTARFPLPADLDLATFPVVDVSLEPADGDPSHSGDSIVRGTLTG